MMLRRSFTQLVVRRCPSVTFAASGFGIGAVITPRRAAATLGQGPPKAGGLPFKLPRGVSTTSLRTIKDDLESDVPTLLMFYVASNQEVATYTEMVVQQLASVNAEKASLVVSHTGGAPPLADGAPPALRLLLVDCIAERQLAASMGVSANAFPIIYFCQRGAMVDKMVGIVTEAQIREALHAFVRFVAESSEKKREFQEKATKRMDEDDENPLTLMQAAQEKLKEKDIAKALQLFRKSARQCEVEVEKLHNKLNLRAKKLTPDIISKLRQDSYYMTLPQALAGEAMALGVSGDWSNASIIAKRIRAEFPWAVQDLRLVADAVVRIELVECSGFDLLKDNYTNLMKKEDHLNDVVAFYRNNVKLAAAHYLERNHKSAIDECLRLIRAEPKLLPALKDAGVVNQEVTLSLNSSTPARRALFLIFEGLGNTHEDVIAARKKIAAFMCI